jgi:hypothetical protein
MQFLRATEVLGLVGLLLALSLGAAAREPLPPPRYATTPMIEPDRCAMAWIVRRYLQPDAVFEFHEREDMPEGVILFDLPEAELKRDARRATVEALLEKTGLSDPFVVRLARLVHEIEIDAWARRDDADSWLLQRVLMEGILAAGPPEQGLEVCFSLLDLLRSADGDVDLWAERVESIEGKRLESGREKPSDGDSRLPTD